MGHQVSNVLITGGCGFIGSSIVELYSRQPDFNIVVLDKLAYSGFAQHLDEIRQDGTVSPFVHEKVDLADADAVQKVFKEYGGFDTVIHVAAESSVDKSIKVYGDFINSNILGSANLFKACLDYKVKKVINFGTDEIYGHLHPGDPQFTEETPLRPRNIYSASKAGQVMMADAFHHTFGLPVVTICPSNCYGPRQLPEKLLPRMIYLLDVGKALPVYGTGKNIREWLYVEDVASAVLTLARKGEVGQKYNVGSGNERTNLEILELLAKKMGKPLEIEFIEDRKGHDFRYSVACDKLKALGWNPRTTLEEGLSKTLAWYENNWEWLDDNYWKIW